MFLIILLLLSPLAIMECQHQDIVVNLTWDSRKPSHNSEYKFQLIPNVYRKGNTNDKYLVIKVEGPYYNDPQIPHNTPEGSMDKLWDYEVAELFLLGDDDHYLETEFGPKGQYLLLQLHGSKNVTKYPLPLKYYSAKIEGHRWKGEAYIPYEYIPDKTTKFNAYAIYGSGNKREYLAAFPTPLGKYKDPDFHRLAYFGALKIHIK